MFVDQTHILQVKLMTTHVLSVSGMNRHVSLGLSTDPEFPPFVSSLPRGLSWVGNTNPSSRPSQGLPLLDWMTIGVAFSGCSSLQALKVSPAFASGCGQGKK